MKARLAFAVAQRPPAAIEPALDRFLTLEARGWKGQTAPASARREGDAQFVRDCRCRHGARHNFEIAELTLNGATIASGLVMRQADRAFFFKIAYDETHGRLLARRAADARTHPALHRRPIHRARSTPPPMPATR